MSMRPPRSTLTDTLFPSTTIVRSGGFKRLLAFVPEPSVFRPIFLESVFLKVGITKLGDRKPGDSRIMRNADRVIIRDLDESEEFCSVEFFQDRKRGRVGKECVSTCISRGWP